MKSSLPPFLCDQQCLAALFSLRAMIRELLAQGGTAADVARHVGAAFDLRKKDIYAPVLRAKS